MKGWEKNRLVHIHLAVYDRNDVSSINKGGKEEIKEVFNNVFLSDMRCNYKKMLECDGTNSSCCFEQILELNKINLDL